MDRVSEIVRDPMFLQRKSVDASMADMPGLAEMYQDYIDGKRELREINMEFNARYVKGEDMPGRERCVYGK